MVDPMTMMVAAKGAEKATAIAKDMAQKMSVPILSYETEGGIEINITPAALVAAGGLAALLAFALWFTGEMEKDPADRFAGGEGGSVLYGPGGLTRWILGY